MSEGSRRELRPDQMPSVSGQRNDVIDMADYNASRYIAQSVMGWLVAGFAGFIDRTTGLHASV